MRYLSSYSRSTVRKDEGYRYNSDDRVNNNINEERRRGGGGEYENGGMYSPGYHSYNRKGRGREGLRDFDNLAFSVTTLLPVNSSEATRANLTATVQDVVLVAASSGLLCQEFKSQGKALNVTLTWNITNESQACPSPDSITQSPLKSPTYRPTPPTPPSFSQSLLTSRSIALLSILLLIALIRFNSDVLSSVFFNNFKDYPTHIYTIAMHNDNDGYGNYNNNNNNNDSDRESVIVENVKHEDILFYRCKKVEKEVNGGKEVVIEVGKEVVKQDLYGEWRMNADGRALELNVEVQFYTRRDYDDYHHYNNNNFNDNYYNKSDTSTQYFNNENGIMKRKDGTQCDDRIDKVMNDSEFTIQEVRKGTIILVKPFHINNQTNEDEIYDKVQMKKDIENGNNYGEKRPFDHHIRKPVRAKTNPPQVTTRVWRRNADFAQTHTQNLSDSNSPHSPRSLSQTCSPLHPSFPPSLIPSPPSLTPTRIFPPPSPLLLPTHPSTHLPIHLPTHLPMHAPMPPIVEDEMSWSEDCVWSNTYVYNDPENLCNTPVELNPDDHYNFNSSFNFKSKSNFNFNLMYGKEVVIEEVNVISDKSDYNHSQHCTAHQSAPVPMSMPMTLPMSVPMQTQIERTHNSNLDNMIDPNRCDIGRYIGSSGDRNRGREEGREGGGVQCSAAKTRASKNYIPFSRHPSSDVSSDISACEREREREMIIGYDEDDDDDDDEEWECRQERVEYSEEDEDDDDDDDDDEWNARIWEEKVKWNNNNNNNNNNNHNNNNTRPSMTVISDLSESIFSSESESDSSYSVTHSYAGSGSLNDFDRRGKRNARPVSQRGERIENIQSK